MRNKSLAIVCILMSSLFSCAKGGLKAIDPSGGKAISLLNDGLKEFLDAPYSPTASDSFVNGGAEVYEPKLIEFSFSETPDYVDLSVDPEFTDYREIEVDTDYFHLENFESDSSYYWRIRKGEEISPIANFSTEKSIRTIKISGVTNSRDSGNWDVYDTNGEKKGMVKQGMLYRTGCLDDADYRGREMVLNWLKVKTELDLRAASEIAYSSFLENYINISSPMYGDPGIFDKEEKETMKEIMSVFATKDNYPIIYHCAIGRDRTGTVAFLLGALLGMKEEDLKKDYDLSFYTVGDETNCPSEMHRNSFDPLLNKMKKYKDASLSLQENVHQYLLDIGLEESQINSIKEILITKA
ncbi:MAG: tyrosine-protein phosphatase [Bacilli bacterium]|nr:tyrosine-protein phosphatase [Bacilli bacterium]